MADKFSNWTTQVCADWLNTVDWAVYDALGTPKTPEEARLNINAVEEAPLDDNAYVRTNRAWTDVSDWPLFSTLVYYLGAHPTFPTTMLDGSPLRGGAMFYHEGFQRPYVYTAHGWSTFESPAPAYQLSLEYIAAGDAPVIDLATLDTQGSSHTLVAGERVDAHAEGLRQLPSSVAVDVGANTVTVANALTGENVVIDILMPASELAYGKVLLWPTWPFTPDGIETSFPLQTVTEVDLHLPSAQALLLYIDGKRQRPDIDYGVSLGTLTMIEAPRADSEMWAYWMEA